MKKIISLVIGMLSITICIAQTSKSINSTEGNLSSQLTEEDKKLITKLIISGSLNQNDFTSIRQLQNLVYIDLSNVQITNNEIPNDAFGFNSHIQTIILPESIKSIGDYAFEYCSLLSSIQIPTGVTQIGRGAFTDCYSLRSISISSGVTELQSFVFANCENLQSIILPENLTSIGLATFSGCRNIDLSLPKNLTTIGSYAFSSCTSIKSLNIGSNVNSIGTNAFGGCNASITVSELNNNYTVENSVLFSKDKTELIACSSLKQGIYTIPASVKAINQEAFRGCNELTTIIIPNTVINVHERAFYSCSALIKYESNATRRISIDGDVFNSDTTIILKVSPQKSGIYTIPNTVTKVADDAFANCSQITEVIMPKNIDTIGEYAFQGCTSLSSVDLPDSLVYIGSGAFQNCGITFIETPQKVKTISASAFSYCFKLKTIVLSDNISRIHSATFNGCSNLQSIIIPTKVTIIDDMAFESCDSLKSIVLPQSLVKIGTNAFANCKNIQSLSIPSTTTTIGNSALYACGGEIIVDDKNPSYSSIDGVLFTKDKTNLIHFPVNKGGDYVVPCSTISSAAFAENHNLNSVTIPLTVNNIGVVAFKNCTAQLIVADANTNYSSNDGILFNKNKSSLIQYPVSKSGSYTVPSSVTSIEPFALAFCDKATSFTVPASVNFMSKAAMTCSNALITVAEDNQFFMSENGVLYSKDRNRLLACPTSIIGDFNIPSQVKNIGSYAFGNCKKIKSFYTPNSIPLFLDGSQFMGCNVKTCTLFVPKGTKEIYNSDYRWSIFSNIEEKDITVSYKSTLNESNTCYPNPTSNGFNVTITEPSKLTMYTIEGTLILEISIFENCFIATKQFNPGIYSVFITSQNSVIHQNIIIQ